MAARKRKNRTRWEEGGEPGERIWVEGVRFQRRNRDHVDLSRMPMIELHGRRIHADGPRECFRMSLSGGFNTKPFYEVYFWRVIDHQRYRTWDATEFATEERARDWLRKNGFSR